MDVITKLCNFKAFLLICIFTLVVPFSVYANEIETVEPLGAGTWDRIYYGSLDVGTSVAKTGSFTSGGGDIRVCVLGVDAGNTMSFQFTRASGAAVGPQYSINNRLGTGVYEETCFPKLDVRPYVDSSGKVTLQVAVQGIKSKDTVWIRVED